MHELERYLMINKYEFFPSTFLFLPGFGSVQLMLIYVFSLAN